MKKLLMHFYKCLKMKMIRIYLILIMQIFIINFIWLKIKMKLLINLV